MARIWAPRPVCVFDFPRFCAFTSDQATLHIDLIFTQFYFTHKNRRESSGNALCQSVTDLSTNLPYYRPTDLSTLSKSALSCSKMLNQGAKFTNLATEGSSDDLEGMDSHPQHNVPVK